MSERGAAGFLAQWLDYGMLTGGRGIEPIYSRPAALETSRAALAISRAESPIG